MDNNSTLLIVVILALVVIAVILGYTGGIKAIFRIFGISLEVEGKADKPSASVKDATSRAGNIRATSKTGDASVERADAYGDVEATSGSESKAKKPRNNAPKA